MPRTGQGVLRSQAGTQGSFPLGAVGARLPAVPGGRVAAAL